MILSCDCICILFWNAPKSKNFIFGSFSVEIDHELIFWNVPFFWFSESDRKNGAFQKIIQMLSHDKIISHILSRAFHDTPRIMSVANDWNHFLVARRFLAYMVTQSSAIGSSFALNDFNITLIKLVIWNFQKSNGTHVNVFGIWHAFTVLVTFSPVSSLQSISSGQSAHV